MMPCPTARGVSRRRPTATSVDDAWAQTADRTAGHQVRYFSVAYKRLEWRLPSWMEAVSTRPAGDGVVDLGERYPELAGRDRELGEFATLFAVRRLLEEDGGDGHDGEMVGLSHYRRFAVTTPLKNGSNTRAALTPAQFEKISRDRLLPPTGTMLAPAAMLAEPTLVAQYASYHPVQDLLRFGAVAVDAGVVGGAALAAYLTDDVLIAAPTVGVFPRAWVLDVLRTLEVVTTEYLATSYVAREGYQRRSVAFCLERILSMLLLQFVRSGPPLRVEMHPVLIVSPDGIYRGNAGEDAG